MDRNEIKKAFNTIVEVLRETEEQCIVEYNFSLDFEVWRSVEKIAKALEIDYQN